MRPRFAFVLAGTFVMRLKHAAEASEVQFGLKLKEAQGIHRDDLFRVSALRFRISFGLRFVFPKLRAKWLQFSFARFASSIRVYLCSSVVGLFRIWFWLCQVGISSPFAALA
jgi:hypothetical protein